MASNQISRLGFDSWSSNLAVNLIENGELKDGYRFECDEYSVFVTKVGDKHIVFVRGYYQGYGWETSEIAY